MRKLIQTRFFDKPIGYDKLDYQFFGAEQSRKPFFSARVGETMSTISKHSAKVVIGAVLAAAMNAAVAQAPAAAENCASCHNDNGVSTDANVPTIAGVGSFFLENQFAIFAEGARPCAADAFGDDEAADHCALVSDLSEDDRMALAEYYGEMSFEPFEQEVDAGLAEQGASIHAASCDRCHTDSGAEPFDDAGILAGQPIPYLIEQFKHYKAGERWQPESMAETMDLSEDQMKALANFYASEAQ